MNKNTIAVEIKDLTKSYKSGQIKALDNVSLSIETGETFGLIGPNGAGKTTLIGCILALLAPDKGTVQIYGKPASYLSVLKQTGYMPERVMFEHWMTAKQFLEFHYGLSKRHKKHMEEEVVSALSRVELKEEVWERRLKTYSRGMLQRLNLAQVLIGKPTFVLLDEPTLGLDPTGVSVVRDVVKEMKDNGTTAIINSHQLDEIERLCNRVAFIENGRIISIETIGNSENSRYVLQASWSTSTLNGSLEAMVNQAAAASKSTVQEINHSWGRFLVQDKKAASVLIRELLANGIPVDEAIEERTKLENLFLKENGVSSHE